MTSLFDLTESKVDSFACTLDGLTATAPDGRTAPLDKCAWAEIAPCGCMAGITTAVNPQKVIRTADEAALEMSCGSKSEAARYAKAGFRMVLVLMEDYRRKGGGLLDIFQIACEHTPKWGYERPSKIVAGHTFYRIDNHTWRTEGEPGSEPLTIEKLHSWYLRNNQRGRAEYLGRTQTEAFAKAAAILAGAS